MRLGLKYWADRIVADNKADRQLLLEDETLLRDVCDMATSSDFDSTKLDILTEMVRNRLEEG
jgi:hypothetical protein